MSTNNHVNKSAARNWLLDVVVFMGGFLAILSGVYFLFLPIGGYQGGRNPMYDVIILFDRHAWEEIHIWTGVIFVLVVILHVALHWGWLSGMIKKIWDALWKKGSRLSSKGRWNAVIDFSIGLSFIISAVSGIAFLAEPLLRSVLTIGMAFNEFFWDTLHTWSSVIMVIGVFLHLAIHWGWIKAVTNRLFRGAKMSASADKGAK